MLSIRERIIRDSKNNDLEARWCFGRKLVQHREKKKLLPKDLLTAIIKELHVSRREVQYRMQFFSTFPSKDQMSTAVDIHKSWTQIKSKALPKKPRTVKAASPATSIIRWANRMAKADPSRLTPEEVDGLEQAATLLTALVIEARSERMPKLAAKAG